MNALLDYIEAWRRHDVHGVLDTLAADCVIIECYGPVYRGRDRVEQWMRAWFGAGGSVDSWEVTCQAPGREDRLLARVFHDGSALQAASTPHRGP